MPAVSFHDRCTETRESTTLETSSSHQRTFTLKDINQSTLTSHFVCHTVNTEGITEDEFTGLLCAKTVTVYVRDHSRRFDIGFEAFFQATCMCADRSTPLCWQATLNFEYWRCVGSGSFSRQMRIPSNNNQFVRHEADWLKGQMIIVMHCARLYTDHWFYANSGHIEDSNFYRP